MSLICSKYGEHGNTIVCEFVCDSVDELLSDAPTTTKMGSGNFAEFQHYANIGSTATVNSDSGVLVYILFSEGWKQV